MLIYKIFTTFQKPSTVTPNSLVHPSVALTTAAAASAAANYQICNNIHAQATPALSNNPGNSTAYGIFLGNKETYVPATPTSPSLIYNQHSTITTNFVPNSLANAALATSPAILYTNPMLTTTTQQYLNTQPTTLATGVNGTGLYERLVYAQMLLQQLYQTQQAAAAAAMFQYKQRTAAAAATIAAADTIAAAARQISSGANVVTNSNRTSPQHLTVVPAPAPVPATTTTSNNNGVTLNGNNSRQP